MEKQEQCKDQRGVGRGAQENQAILKILGFPSVDSHIMCDAIYPCIGLNGIAFVSEI